MMTSHSAVNMVTPTDRTAVRLFYIEMRVLMRNIAREFRIFQDRRVCVTGDLH